MDHAYRQLLGITSLPQSGEEAFQATSSYANAVQRAYGSLSTTTDQIKSINISQVYQENKIKQRFVDVSTGMRLCYLEWPCSSSEDVIIFLHDISRTADSWIPIATSLNDRGYTVYALNMRGHGGSSRCSSSSTKSYSASLMAEDVKEFIIAKDLYVRPVALVGTGIGAAVALTLAGRAPMLVGAVACIEFCLQQPDVDTIRDDRNASHQSQPCWSFWLGQGAGIWSSPIQLASFLSSPLANLGPVNLPELLQAQDQRDENTRELLQRLARPLSLTLVEASTMLSSQPSIAKTTTHLHDYYHYDDDNILDGSYQLKMDPHFFFSFDVSSLTATLRHLKPHFLLLYGQNSPFISPDAAQYTFNLVSSEHVASKSLVAIPQGSHHVVVDSKAEVLSHLIAFLEGPAINFSNIPPGPNSRKPETLNIRPLPEYESIEEAKKALGPRAVPTAAAVEEELKKLRVAEGREETEVSTDEEDEIGNNKYRTGLAKDPSDYFAFVG